MPTCANAWVAPHDRRSNDHSATPKLRDEHWRSMNEQPADTPVILSSARQAAGGVTPATASPVRAVLATARVGNWWHSKLPPLFAIAYAAMLVYERPWSGALPALAETMIALCAVAWYAHVVNDLFDIDDDASSGRANRMAGFTRASGWLLAAALLLGGMGIVAWLLTASGTLLLLFLNYLVFTLYSVPPVRLKVRTWWGVTADAAGAHVIPALFVMAAIRGTAPISATGVLMAASVLTWSLCAGLRNILVHQYGDRDADRRAGVHTVGNSLGRERLRSLVLRVIAPVETLGLIMFVAVLGQTAPVLLLAVPVFVALELLKVGLRWRMRLFPDAAASVERYRPLVNNDAYELWLPFVLGLALALNDPRFAVVPALHLALFYRGVRPRARDFTRIIRDAGRSAQRLARSRQRSREPKVKIRVRSFRVRRPLSNLTARRLGAGLTRVSLTLERMFGNLSVSSDRKPRVIATACWTFPIYSQTFVYEELEQLSRHGFDVRFLYVEPTSREELGGRFSRLWRRRRRTYMDPRLADEDMAWFRKRMPDRVAALTDILSRESGLTKAELEANDHYRMGFSFARVAAAYRPDYLHSYFFYEGSLFTYMASWLLDVPRGVSCYADHRLNDFTLKLVTQQLRACDVVVATSRRIGHELERITGPAGSANIVVKPNAIDTTRFPYVDRRLPAKGEPIVLVAVSRLDPKKGLHYLIEAVRLLLDQGTPVRLHIVGDADQDVPASREYGERLVQRVAEFQLGRSVIFEGRCPQPVIRRLLSDSHVFVAPFVELASGDSDGIPTALMEAMSTGAPVVATDSGSITEVVEHEVTGLLVQQHSARAIAEAVGRLAVAPELCARLGRAAAAFAREELDVQSCERHFHERVRRVINRRQMGGTGSR